MSGQSEDDAWRSIVENYGDRPQVEAAPAPTPDPAPDPGPTQETLGEPEVWDDPWDDERFVPAPSPPQPLPPPRRLAAWIGIYGAPAVLMLALLTGLTLPTMLAYALVAAFVGGFGYLVVTMQRGPRDPGDDGARL